MNLIEILKSWDVSLLLSINGLHTSFLDSFMYVVSSKFIWVPLYISVLYLVVKYWKREAIWLVLALVLCVVISDQISSDILKHLVKRLRPTHTDNLKDLIHLVKGYSGGLYGFASSHAANTFGFALLSSLLFKRKIYTYAIFIWSLIIIYSRIYLGVHYPFDIFGGIVVGSFAALVIYWIIRKYKPSLVQNRAYPNPESKTILIPVLVLALSFFGIIVYSVIV
ncbi:MAG: phosphatase PAP2 family protein [Paludibacter sp.]|nr:phosphatase PAP2 family protein [Paludibacter sp.]